LAPKDIQELLVSQNKKLDEGWEVRVANSSQVLGLAEKFRSHDFLEIAFDPKAKYTVSGGNWRSDLAEAVPITEQAFSDGIGLRLAYHKVSNDSNESSSGDGSQSEASSVVRLGIPTTKEIYRLLFGHSSTIVREINQGWNIKMNEVENALGQSDFWHFEYLRGLIYAGTSRSFRQSVPDRDFLPTVKKLLYGTSEGKK
jgi:hypothetical protein